MINESMVPNRRKSKADQIVVTPIICSLKLTKRTRICTSSLSRHFGFHLPAARVVLAVV